MKSFLKSLLLILVLLGVAAAGIFLVNFRDESLLPELAVHFTERPVLAGRDRETLALWMGYGHLSPAGEGEKFLRVIESLPVGPLREISRRLRDAGWGVSSSRTLAGEEELVRQLRELYGRGGVDLRPLIGTGVSFSFPSMSRWAEGHRAWLRDVESRGQKLPSAASEELRQAVTFLRGLLSSESVFLVKDMALTNLHLTAQSLNELVRSHPEWAARLSDDFLGSLRIKKDIPSFLEDSKVGEVKDFAMMIDEAMPDLAPTGPSSRAPKLITALTYSLLQKNKTLNWVWTIEGEELASTCQRPPQEMCSPTYDEVTASGPRWLVNPTGRTFVKLVTPKLRNMTAKWNEKAGKIEAIVQRLEEAKKLSPAKVKAFLGET
ncbi:MAG: hypothetical protein KF802_13580 [Bdellovibrionaceae bacterium]|nr:hypothetical protein [Pseudobdellovibrionaceae bacterium]MBX3034471.1 hypothetical protein [Pseudobdellovibrionaceae bacterium]